MKKTRNLMMFLLIFAVTLSVFFAGKITAKAATEETEERVDFSNGFNDPEISLGVVENNTFDSDVFWEMPEFEVGSEKTSPQNVYVKVLILNNTSKDYTIDESSFLKWTLSSEKEGIDSVDINASFAFLSTKNDDENGEIVTIQSKTLESETAGYVYFTLPTLANNLVTGQARLSEVSVNGKKAGSDTMFCSKLLVSPENSGKLIFSFGNPSEEGGMQIKDEFNYSEGADFKVLNVDEDTTAPKITQISYIYGDLYTGDPVAYKVTYEDDKSEVAEISLVFKHRTGTARYTGSISNIEEGTVNEKNHILGKSGTKSIALTLGSRWRGTIGEYELEKATITDTEGNTRIYGPNYETNLYHNSDTIVKFKTIALEDCVKVSAINIKEVEDKDALHSDSDYVAEVTLVNNSGKTYTVKASEVRWESETEEKEFMAVSDATYTIANNGTAKISIPITFSEKEICGKWLLRNIYISGTVDGEEMQIECNILSNGTTKNFYGNNFVNPALSNPDADFTVHHVITERKEPSYTEEGSIVEKCSICTKVFSTTSIPKLTKPDTGEGSGTGTTPTPTPQPSVPETPAPQLSVPETPAPQPSAPSVPSTHGPEKGTKLTDSKTKAVYQVTNNEVNGETVVYTKSSNKNAKSITIPATVTIGGIEYKVTSIANDAFKNNKKLTKITIGNNVTSIGKNAFYGCKKLKTVKMGKNVTTIGSNAFKGCTALTSLTLYSKVTKIGSYAFNGCKKLKSLTIQTTYLTTKGVSKNAFKGLTKITTIKAPKKKLKSYKKLFKSRGLSSKVKVK